MVFWHMWGEGGPQDPQPIDGAGLDLDLWGPWAVQNVGAPLPKFLHLVPIPSFKSFSVLVLLQIGDLRVLKLQNQIYK